MRHFVATAYFTLLLFCFAGLYWVSGSSDDIPVDTPKDKPFFRESESVGDTYFARILHEDNLVSLTEFEMEVKITEGQSFPTITHKNAQWEGNVHVRIILRDTDTPENPLSKDSRKRPHKEVEREERRFVEGRIYLWHLVSPETCETLLLKNVQLSPETFYRNDGEKVRGFLADVHVRIGQVDHDIREYLEADGFALIGGFTTNWGLRNP